MSKYDFSKLTYKKPSMINSVELFTGIHNGEIGIDTGGSGDGGSSNSLSEGTGGTDPTPTPGGEGGGN